MMPGFVPVRVFGIISSGRPLESTYQEWRYFMQPYKVEATLTKGSPGQLLNLDIGGHELTAFCNSTSAGQCGA